MPTAQELNAAKQVEDDVTSRGSAGGRSQGARKSKAIAEANAEKEHVEKERGELGQAIDIFEAQLDTGTRQYDSEDGTRASRVKTTAMARVLRSVSSTTKGPRPKEHEIVGLEVEESVAERVARLIAHQAGARGSSSPETRHKTRQAPRLSARSDESAGSDLISGSQLQKHKYQSLSFADALIAPTPEEEKPRERVELRKRRNKKQNPEKGKDGNKDVFVIGHTFDATGPEWISLVAATLREIGKQGIEWQCTWQ